MCEKVVMSSFSSDCLIIRMVAFPFLIFSSCLIFFFKEHNNDTSFSSLVKMTMYHDYGSIQTLRDR